MTESALKIHARPTGGGYVKTYIWLSVVYTIRSCSPNKSSSCALVKEKPGEAYREDVPKRIPKTCWIPYTLSSSLVHRPMSRADTDYQSLGNICQPSLLRQLYHFGASPRSTNSGNVRASP